jgi:glycosyltransferase involved in cell wall biosynthesis
MSAPIIVLVAPRQFLAADDGGRIKTASLCTALQQCGELHVLLTDNHPHEGRWFRGESQPLPFGGRAFLWSCVPTQGWLIPLWCKELRLRQWSATRLLLKIRPTLVVADDITTTPTAFRASAPVICHAHNLESLLYADEVVHFEPRMRRRRLRRARVFRAIEERCYPRAAEVWGVRADDVDHFVSLGARRARVMPNTLPESRFDAPSVGRAGEVLFFGSLWWPPNAQAVEYLMDAASGPRAAAAGLRISVAGLGAERLRLSTTPPDSARWRLLGFVDDLKALARESAVVAIPLTSGGGTKLKTLEALALGKPVVTTPEGVAGLDLVDGRHVLIREPGAAFDEVMIEVATHPQRYAGLAAAGQALVRERYSQATVDRGVRDAVTAILAERARDVR